MAALASNPLGLRTTRTRPERSFGVPAVLLALPLILVGCLASHSDQGPSPVGEAPLTSTLSLPSELETAPRIRLVLVGDTGEGTAARDRVIESIRSEEKDLVAVLGDLVYPRAPRCPDGRLSANAEETLEELVGSQFRSIGSATVLVLGNHDVVRSTLGVFRSEDPTMEACFLAYGKAVAAAGVHIPSRHFVVHAGPATIAVVSSSGAFLDAAAAEMAKSAFGERTDDWDVLLAHDVYLTYHDRDAEADEHLRSWMAEHDVTPSIVANGHAHVLQAGLYNETGAPGSLIAITSGTGAKRRVRPECSESNAEGCGPGQIYGSSEYGYAVLDMGPEGARVTFKDQDGAHLWSCLASQPGECVPIK